MDTILDIGLSNAALAGVMAPAAALLGWCLRRRPAVVHALWVLVLLKLVTPSLVHVDVPWTAAADDRRIEAMAAIPSDVLPTRQDAPAALDDIPIPNSAPPPLPISWRSLVATIWLTGTAVWWAVAVWRVVRFRRLLRTSAPAPAVIRHRVAQLANRFGLRSVPDAFVVPARVSPMLWAPGGTARLLLPAELWDELTVEQQDAVLAHELAHLRRGDPWVRRLELLVGGLYWWHPAVWWAGREIEAAEEECCDAWVAWALPGSAEAYAAALVSTVTYLSGRRPPLPAGASGVGHVRTLKRRLAMIVHGTKPGAAARALPPIVLLVGAIALLWLPTWAQSDPPERKPAEPLRVQSRPDPPTPTLKPAPPGPDASQFVGSVQAARQLVMTAAVAGQVVKVAVDSGATVKKGDLLAELDPRRAQLELQRATAKLLIAKAQADNVRSSVQARAIPQSELPIAEANLKLAETEVELARLAVDATRIVAPMDGTVLRWHAQVGQNVAIGHALGELADLRRMMAVVNVPTREVSRLAVGRRCRIKVEATNDVYQGTVGRIDAEVNPQSGTVIVSVTIDPSEKGDHPRPGSFVQVQFAGKE